MGKFRHALGHAAFGVALLACAIDAVNAGSFEVTPLRVSLSATQRVAALSLRNVNSDPVVVQVDVVAWSQAKGEDVFAPTREVLATPPIFTVPPGGTQLIRVGLRRAPDALHELSYRIFLTEIPPPVKADATGLQETLRFSIPVFVPRATSAADRGGKDDERAVPVSLTWRVTKTASNYLAVVATNQGNSHVQVIDFTLAVAGNTQPLATTKVPEYVLPGQQSRPWSIATDAHVASGTPLHVTSHTDSGDIAGDVVVDEPQ